MGDWRWSAAFLAFGLAACDGGGSASSVATPDGAVDASVSPSADAGVFHLDVGTGPEAGAGDAGTLRLDAGPAAPDAALPDAAPPDCGPALDTDQLEAAVEWIEANAPAVDSILVSHCGALALERYFNGYGPNALHELQSATKTFAAMLVGVALTEGLIEGLDQPIADLLPEYAALLTGPKAAITLRHALTMTTGLRWQDFGAGNSFERIAAAPDSVAFVLSEPLVTAAGDAFFYNTGSSHLLSAIVARQTARTTAAYAEERLFAPLGIDGYVWPALADGVHQGGWGMYLTPRDFLAFGQLLLDRGVVNGTPLIDPGFVDAATVRQVPTGVGGGYGFQMWIDTHEFEADDIAAARGYGGQDCFVLDGLDMVVVFTGDIRFPEAMARDVRTIMNRFVLPAHPGGRP